LKNKYIELKAFY